MKRPDWFLVGMVAAVALAFAFPQAGAKGGALRPELLNKLGVALIFFLHGLMLSFEALRSGTRKWQVHLLIQASTYLLFPVLGLGLLWLTQVRAELRVGLFFLCALPSTVSSSVALTAAAGADVAVAVFNATLSSLLGVVLTPLWLNLVLGASGHTPPFASVVWELTLWLVLPLVVGQLLRPWLGVLVSRHRRYVGVADRSTILLLVYTSFCDSVQAGVWRQGLKQLAFAAISSLVLLAAALCITWAAGRALGFPRAERVAALFCGSKKSLAAGIPMARVIFGAEAGLAVILLPIMIYHPLQLVVGGWLAGRFRASASQPA